MRFFLVAVALLGPVTSAAVCTTNSCTNEKDETSLMQLKTTVTHGEKSTTSSGYTDLEWLQYLPGGYCIENLEQMVECMVTQKDDWKKTPSVDDEGVKKMYAAVEKYGYDRAYHDGEEWGVRAPEVQKKLDELSANQKRRIKAEKEMGALLKKTQGSLAASMDKANEKQRELLQKEIDETNDLDDLLNRQVNDVDDQVGIDAKKAIDELLKKTSLMQSNTIMQKDEKRAPPSGWDEKKWLDYLIGGYCVEDVKHMVECMETAKDDWKKTPSVDDEGVKKMYEAVKTFSYDVGYHNGEDWGVQAPQVKAKLKELDIQRKHLKEVATKIAQLDKKMQGSLAAGMDKDNVGDRKVLQTDIDNTQDRIEDLEREANDADTEVGVHAGELIEGLLKKT